MSYPHRAVPVRTFHRLSVSIALRLVPIIVFALGAFEIRESIAEIGRVVKEFVARGRREHHCITDLSST